MQTGHPGLVKTPILTVKGLARRNDPPEAPPLNGSQERMLIYLFNPRERGQRKEELTEPT